MTEETKPSVQKIVDAKGVQLTIDYFLYSCFEHERTRFAQSADKCAEERWPLLHGEEKVKIASSELNDLISDLVDWYADAYPELKNQAAVDHERLDVIISPLVLLTADITLLVETKSEKPFPSYDKNKSPDEIWMAMLKKLTEVFQSQSVFYSQYLQWTHGADEPEEPEPGSRPPVGKYAPRFRDRPDSRDRGPRNSSKPARAPRGKPPQRGGRDNKRDAPKGRGRPDNKRGGGDPDRSARLEESAKKDVLKAINSLNGDPSLKDVALPPANSFYRRLQHRQADDQGYTSSSIGEGKERAVSIMPKKD